MSELTPASKKFWKELNKGIGGESEEMLKYFSDLTKKDKKSAYDNLKKVSNNSEKPMLFRILDLDISVEQRAHLLKQFKTINFSHGDQSKLKVWLDRAMKIPFGVNKGIELNSIKPKEVTGFLDNLTQVMDEAVWGHEEAKRKIIQIMGQNIRNPKSKGNVLGIWGCPGNGKTTLIKEGISKALNKPFVFISLGGATDASFLEGHSYTYEGSIPGRIAEGIINANVIIQLSILMNWIK